jgi:spermidine/putrescine transport system permease protein
MIGLLVIPLTMTVITSFGQRDPDGNVIYSFTLENYWRLLGFGEEGGWNDIYLTILLRSLWLALQTTVIVILMAYPLAYFIARAAPNRRTFYLFLVLVPLWTNFVIRIYAWVMILRTQGVLNSSLGWAAGLLNVPFTPFELYPSQGAVLIGMSMSSCRL